MGINSYNHEGYLNLTVYEALKNIEKHRKLVFICSPFAGDIEGNTERARRYGRFAVTKNAVPFIPHLLFPQFLNEDDPEERRLGIDMGMHVLKLCKEIWVFGNRISSGMAVEINKAKSLGIPIKYFTVDCRQVKEVK